MHTQLSISSVWMVVDSAVTGYKYQGVDRENDMENGKTWFAVTFGPGTVVRCDRSQSEARKLAADLSARTGFLHVVVPTRRRINAGNKVSK